MVHVSAISIDSVYHKHIHFYDWFSEKKKNQNTDGKIQPKSKFCVKRKLKLPVQNSHNVLPDWRVMVDGFMGQYTLT